MEAPIMFEKFWFDLIWSQIWTQDSQDCERYFCAMPVPHKKVKVQMSGFQKKFDRIEVWTWSDFFPDKISSFQKIQLDIF